jgi:hypothetical protein
MDGKLAYQSMTTDETNALEKSAQRFRNLEKQLPFDSLRVVFVLNSKGLAVFLNTGDCFVFFVTFRISSTLPKG